MQTDQTYKEGTEQNRMTELSIPKLIHFIWAGGEKLMGDAAVSTVASWCQQNPTCEVGIWVDPAVKGGMTKLKKAYGELFGKYSVAVRIEGGDNDHLTENQLVLKDITLFKSELYQSEIAQLLPNFGCSSDILRLQILAHFGGFYFDQDVCPNPRAPLEKSDLFKLRDKHTVVLEHRPQRSKPIARSAQALKRYYQFFDFTLETVGNDSMASTPGNPIMQGMLASVISNYRLTPDDREKIIAECYGAFDRHSRTVIRTGPKAIRDFLTSNYMLDRNKRHLLPKECKQAENTAVPEVALEAMRSHKRILTLPRRNDRGWLNVEVASMRNLTTVLEPIIERIKFEIDHFKVLLLDYHLHLAFDSVAVLNNKQRKLVTAGLLKAVGKLDLSRVELAQISLQYSATIDFCKRKNLNTLFDLEAEEFNDALVHLLQMAELQTLLSVVKEREDKKGLTPAQIFPIYPGMEQRLWRRIHDCLDSTSLLFEKKNYTFFSTKQQSAICHYIINQKNLFSYAIRVFGKDVRTKKEVEQLRMRALHVNRLANEQMLKLARFTRRSKIFNARAAAVKINNITEATIAH